MHPTVSQYAKALEELAERAASEQVAEIAKDFLGFLKRRGEAEKIGAIVKHLERLEAEKESRVSVTVVTAHETDPETRAALELQAAQLFPHKKIELRYAVDRALIGGALFRTDETLYDATLASGVRTLRNSLLKA